MSLFVGRVWQLGCFIALFLSLSVAFPAWADPGSPADEATIKSLPPATSISRSVSRSVSTPLLSDVRNNFATRLGDLNDDLYMISLGGGEHVVIGDIFPQYAPVAQYQSLNYPAYTGMHILREVNNNISVSVGFKAGVLVAPEVVMGLGVIIKLP